MGSGASTVTPKNQFDDHETLETKLLSSGESLSAFLKYLEGKRKDCLLTWFLDILEYKATESKNLLAKAMEIRSRYDHMVNKPGEDSKTMLTIWKSVNNTLPCKLESVLWREPKNQKINEKTLKKLEDTKKFTLSLIANEVDDFLKSEYAHEWKNAAIGRNFVGKKYLTKVNTELSPELKQKYNNVLIIEDSPISSSRMTKLLEINGHFVCQAHHGRVGIHLASVAVIKFDAILIDMNMKTMDSLDVVRQLKAFYNGKVYKSKSIRLDRCQSVHLSKPKRFSFHSSKTANKSVKETDTLCDDYNENENKNCPLFISLSKNNPTYRCNKTFFNGSINLTTFCESQTVADVSILALMFEFHTILKNQHLLEENENDNEIENDNRKVSSVCTDDDDDVKNNDNNGKDGSCLPFLSFGCQMFQHST